MGSIADKLERVLETKRAIGAALREKGQEVLDTEPFSAYAGKIMAISAGDTITNAREVEVVAADRIRVGDTVYTEESGAGTKIGGVGQIIDLNGTVLCIAYSPDGRTMVLGGSFEGKAKVYSVDKAGVSFVSDIYADGENTALSGDVNAVAFSSDGKTLVLGGAFTGKAKVYSVSGTKVSYVSDIYADAGTTAWTSTVYSAAFSPDGKILVLGGNSTRSSAPAKVYSVNDGIITYAGEIACSTGKIQVAAFSQDGKVLVFGGSFIGRARAYSVDGTTITYTGVITADADHTTPINGYVYSAKFSPDGKTLVLLYGFLSGGAKVYDVNGTTFDFMGDIDMEEGFCPVDGGIAFSVDGKRMVLGWRPGPAQTFDDVAKYYSVEGAEFSNISDIDVGEETTGVNTAEFSPDGELLVLGTEACALVYRLGKDMKAHLIPDGNLAEHPAGCGFGFSKSDMEAGETGVAVLIGTIA